MHGVETSEAVPAGANTGEREHPVPEIGQIVTVRGANWAVTEVAQQGLPRGAQDDTRQQLQHAVTLRSVEDDRMGDELRVVWELEPGKSLKPQQDLPEVIQPDRFDKPERLAAFIDAPGGRSSTGTCASTS